MAAFTKTVPITQVGIYEKNYISPKAMIRQIIPLIKEDILELAKLLQLIVVLTTTPEAGKHPKHPQAMSATINATVSLSFLKVEFVKS